MATLSLHRRESETVKTLIIEQGPQPQRRRYPVVFEQVVGQRKPQDAVVAEYVTETTEPRRHLSQITQLVRPWDLYTDIERWALARLFGIPIIEHQTFRLSPSLHHRTFDGSVDAQRHTRGPTREQLEQFTMAYMCEHTFARRVTRQSNIECCGQRTSKPAGGEQLRCCRPTTLPRTQASPRLAELGVDRIDARQ
jgi:hypothetical protein